MVVFGMGVIGRAVRRVFERWGLIVSLLGQRVDSW